MKKIDFNTSIVGFDDKPIIKKTFDADFFIQNVNALEETTDGTIKKSAIVDITKDPKCFDNRPIRVLDIVRYCLGVAQIEDNIKAYKLWKLSRSIKADVCECTDEEVEMLRDLIDQSYVHGKINIYEYGTTLNALGI